MHYLNGNSWVAELGVAWFVYLRQDYRGYWVNPTCLN